MHEPRSRSFAKSPLAITPPTDGRLLGAAETCRADSPLASSVLRAHIAAGNLERGDRQLDSVRSIAPRRSTSLSCGKAWCEKHSAAAIRDAKSLHTRRLAAELQTAVRGQRAAQRAAATRREHS